MAFSLGGATPFGATSTTSTPSFGFGTSTPSTGFGFGTQPTTTTSSGFSFGGFGTQAKTTAATGFSFGAPTATTASGFSFGAPAASSTTTGFSFGGGPTSTASTGFSFGGASTGTSAFTGGSAFPSFGTGLGGTSSTAGQTAFGFGLGTQQTNPLQPQQPTSNLENIAAAVTLPQLYGDERDAIIAKWNQLQAAWGTGKGVYNQRGSVDFTPDNPYCRFKNKSFVPTNVSAKNFSITEEQAVGYNRLPKTKNEDGLVSLFIKKSEEEVRKNQQLIVDALFAIFGSKPQLSVCVEGIKKLPDSLTEFVVYILERPASGPARRIPSNETTNFLTGQLANLKSKLLVENVVPKMGFTEQALKEYLDTPQEGIHPFLWQQAKLDNPDPDNLVPVPMIGFKALHQRLKHQEQQTQAHQQRLDLISEDLESLQQKQVNMLAKLEEYKRKHIQLSHRLLQVIVKQEISRKMGYSIQAEEEHLRVQLEKIQLELNHPTQFKGRLNELMSQIRMQNHLAGMRNDVSYQMDPSLQEEIKHLISEDLESLQQKQVNMLAKLEEYKRKHIQLSHRLLQVIVKQEISRKMGYSIQAEEEHLRVQLEKIQLELNHPTQFKVSNVAHGPLVITLMNDLKLLLLVKKESTSNAEGRLNELMSQIRMQNHLAGMRNDVSYQMDPSLQEEIKHLLKQQQEGLKHLVDIIKDDAQDIQLMEQNLEASSFSQR